MGTTIKIQIEIEVEVEGKYIPGDPGVWTYSNGDPGYPATPPEFEIHKVLWGKTDIVDLLSDDDLWCIEEQMLNINKNEDIED